jgi:hypothetical protein
MKKIIPFLFAAILLSACLGTVEDNKRDNISAQPQPAEMTKSCGDGVCDGPENAQSCPEDCQDPPGETDNNEGSSAPADAAQPPLYFFYVIHTHGSDEFLPYADPGQTTIDAEKADNMLAAIAGIAEVLDQYGVKASWQFLPATIKGFHQYQGPDNIITQLLSSGHEIGVHTHKLDDLQFAVENLNKYCGIYPEVTSGFLAQLSGVSPGESKVAMSIAIDVPVKLGLSVGTTNLSPGGGKNPLASECQEVLGVGNDMWPDTGNLMFPWRPDYAHKDPCSHNPEADMLLIDHVSIEWLILPGEAGPPDVLANTHFTQLQGQFDGALNYMAVNKPDRTATWGFITHITEYAVGGKGEYPPDQESLAALETFLEYVDTKRDLGLVVYKTPAQIAELVENENQ